MQVIDRETVRTPSKDQQKERLINNQARSKCNTRYRHTHIQSMDSKQETATRDTNQQPSKIKMQWRQLKTKRLRTPKKNHHHHHHHHHQQQQQHCNFDSTFKHETNYRNIVLRLPWGIEMNEGWSSSCCNNNNNTAILSDAEEQGKGKSPWLWRNFFATRQTGRQRDRPSCRFAPII